MSKHQEILDYLEKLPIGKRVSVRSISNFLNVSDGTAYRAIKEAENQGIVETRPRSGTIRVKSKKAVLEHLTYREILEITGSEILAGEEGLEKEFNKFYIGAMTEKHVLDYVSEGGLLIVGDRTSIQRLALKHDNAVLVTGGFEVSEDVIDLANQVQIPVIRTSHDTYTVATMINKALSNMQIKTDILTVEQVYRPFHEYGYLSETDTVRDYLDLVRKNRFSRFPVVNQHQMVVGVVTMRDAGDKAPQTTLDKVMSRTIFTTNLSTSIATISQRMIAEDYEMIPVVRNNQTLLGVITRRDVMDRISKVQFSSLPTFSEQIGQKISGVLANGVMIEVLMKVIRKMMQHSGRSLIVEQLIINFLQAVQVDDVIRIEPQLVRRTRRSALVDFSLYLDLQLVAKATITIKIN